MQRTTAAGVHQRVLTACCAIMGFHFVDPHDLIHLRRRLLRRTSRRGFLRRRVNVQLHHDPMMDDDTGSASCPLELAPCHQVNRWRNNAIALRNTNKAVSLGEAEIAASAAAETAAAVM